MRGRGQSLSNVAIFCPSLLGFNPKSASGATERLHWELGHALQGQGHSVQFVTAWDGRVDGADVIISQEAEVFQGAKPGARCIWWLHHFSDQPVVKRNAPYARAARAQVVTLSACHQKEIRQALRMDSVVIPNWCSTRGWETPRLERPDHSFLYAAAPFKGLGLLADLWPELWAHFPGATLDVCSSMALYGQPAEDRAYHDTFAKLAEHGAVLHGAVPPAELHRLMQRTRVFLAPSTFPETYCVTLDEAHAFGMASVVSKLGALADRGCQVVEGNGARAWKRGVSLALGDGMVKKNGGLFRRPSEISDVLPAWSALLG